MGGGGGARGAAVAYLAALGSAGAVVAGAGSGGLVWPEGGGGGGHGAAVALVVAPRGGGSGGSGVSGGRGGIWGSGSGGCGWLRRGGGVGSVGAVGECAVRGGGRKRRRLRDWASSLESGQSGGVGGSWGASRGAAWYWGGGGGPPSSMDPPRRGVVVAAAAGMGRVTVLGGVQPGGPLRRGRGGWGDTDTVPGTGGWLVRGGWPLAVGGWSARWLQSHSLVLFVHGGLWPGGVGWWAVIVVGVVLVVVVVGPLVVVVLVVVGLVLRIWPMDPLWVFRSPLWRWRVGHRGQPLGLHYVMGRRGGWGAGLDCDGGRGVERPWVGLAGGGGGLRGMDDGALGDGDADEGLDGVVLGGRLCSVGGCRWEGGVGCGGWGVLAWFRVRVGVVSVGFVSLRLWCCVCSRGRWLGFGVGFGVGVRFQV